MDIQQLFLERLPRRPYCADDCSCGLLVRQNATALQYRHIQPNPPQAAAWMIFDLDYPGAALAWEDKNLPVPTIVVSNRANGHAHLFYGLETPVCTSVNARNKPQRYFKAIKQAMRIQLNADPGYCGLMAKNPLHSGWHTQWMPKLYDLGELAEYVPLLKQGPPASEPNEMGRNCTLFDMLRRWAYRQLQCFTQRGGSYDHWYEVVLNQAELINASTFRHDPLPFSEARATAKSVATWSWRNLSDEARAQAFSELQSRRGQRGGRPRTTTKDGEPWAELGISRATWYRRRKAGLPSTESNAESD